jgi:hypothetical protein
VERSELGALRSDGGLERRFPGSGCGFALEELGEFSPTRIRYGGAEGVAILAVVNAHRYFLQILLMASRMNKPPSHRASRKMTALAEIVPVVHAARQMLMVACRQRDSLPDDVVAGWFSTG